jgi:hypothetical protein
MNDSLQALVDRSAILSAEVQQKFGALIAGSDFDIDFSAAPRLRFTGDDPVDFRPHMIGSSVDRRADRTWHWGWDNLNGFPTPVIALSQQIREYGAARDITELTQPELPVESAETPTAYTLAAKAITGAWAHYPVQAGGGTTVWVLVDDSRLDPGEPQHKPVVKALASAITTTDVSDHRAALSAYAELRGLRTAPLPDGGVRLLCEDGSADVTFDDAGRVSSCQAHQPLEGEAADQFEAAGHVVGTAAFGKLAVDEGEEPLVASSPSKRDEDVTVEAPVTLSETTQAPDDDVADAVETDETLERDAASPAAQQSPAEQSAPSGSSSHVEAVPEAEQKDEQPEKKGFFKRLFGR